MTDRLRRFCVFVAILPWLASCNIFAPFDTDTSDQDHLEEALHCLDNKDSQCAVDKLNEVSDGNPTKALELCEVQLSSAGLTLDTLVNVVLNSSTQSGYYLGVVSQALMPWSADKSSAIAAALTSCAGLTASAQGDLAVLLQSLAALTDCSLRIARTDQCRCSSDDLGSPGPDPYRNLPTCSAVGDNDNVIQKADIGSQFGGAVDATHPGMCESEIKACLYDLASVAAQQLGDLSKLQQAINAIPAQLKDTSTGYDAARGLLETQVAQ